MTDPTSDDVRDDFILQERLSGKSARTISKQLRCTVGEVDAALDRVLPTLDAARLRHISLDLSRLDGLLETFYKRAIEKVDSQAALACVKIMERKAALLGLDQPTKLDVISVQAAESALDEDDRLNASNRDRRRPSYVRDHPDKFSMFSTVPGSGALSAARL